MTTKKILSADVYEDGTVVVNMNGVEKKVAFNSFQRFITEDFQEKESGSDKPQPAATSTVQMPLGLLYLSDTGKRGVTRHISGAMLYPEQTLFVRHVHGDPDEQYRIPLPRTLISFRLMADSTDYRYAFLSDSVRYNATWEPISGLRNLDRTSDKRSVLPIPNMYDTGRMCFGKVSLPTRIPPTDLRQLEWLYDLIADSPFNNDLAIRDVELFNANRIFREILVKTRHLRGSFPEYIKDMLTENTVICSSSTKCFLWLKFLSLFDKFPYAVLQGTTAATLLPGMSFWGVLRADVFGIIALQGQDYPEGSLREILADIDRRVSDATLPQEVLLF
jgi:hypothetical protein